MKNEIWKDIKGYEGYYQVSNFGRVKSIERKVNKWDGIRTINERILKQNLSHNGYYFVSLSKNGKRRTYRVNRLVAEAFIPNPDNLPQVNHKEENKLNNNVENLEWCTSKYNNNYGTHNDKISKRLSKPVLQLDKNGNFIKLWESIMSIERETGFFQGSISNCCKGKYKTSYGYKWKYNI